MAVFALFNVNDSVGIRIALVTWVCLFCLKFAIQAPCAVNITKIANKKAEK